MIKRPYNYNIGKGDFLYIDQVKKYVMLSVIFAKIILFVGSGAVRGVVGGDKCLQWVVAIEK
jgi:hypothetical protein